MLNLLLIATCHRCGYFAMQPAGVAICAAGQCQAMECVREETCPHPAGQRFGKAGRPAGAAVMPLPDQWAPRKVRVPLPVMLPSEEVRARRHICAACEHSQPSGGVDCAKVAEKRPAHACIAMGTLRPEHRCPVGKWSRWPELRRPATRFDVALGPN
jgi:hypothetical protein